MSLPKIRLKSIQVNLKGNFKKNIDMKNDYVYALLTGVALGFLTTRLLSVKSKQPVKNKLDELKTKMWEAAREEKYEDAVKLRDEIAELQQGGSN